ALLDRGELDEAQRVLDQSGMADRRDVRDVTLDPLARARARLRVLRGDPAGARADLESISRSDARWNTDRTLEPPVLIAAELLSDDVEAERERVERMLAQARAWGTPRAVGVAVRAAGL